MDDREGKTHKELRRKKRRDDGRYSLFLCTNPL